MQTLHGKGLDHHLDVRLSKKNIQSVKGHRQQSPSRKLEGNSYFSNTLFFLAYPFDKRTYTGIFITLFPLRYVLHGLHGCAAPVRDVPVNLHCWQTRSRAWAPHDCLDPYLSHWFLVRS